MKICGKCQRQFTEDEMFCPECGGVLTLVNVDEHTKFYLCKECLSTWVTDVENNTETELQRYFFG